MRIETFQHCLQAEFDSYAQECKKKGGFFKCCVSRFRMDIFHLIRYELKKRNLIRRGPQKLYCGERFEERDKEIMKMLTLFSTFWRHKNLLLLQVPYNQLGMGVIAGLTQFD